MITDLDTFLIALYVELTDRIIPARGFTRSGPGKPPAVTDAELVCLAVAQVLLRYDEERHWLRAAPKRIGHLFPRSGTRGFDALIAVGASLGSGSWARYGSREALPGGWPESTVPSRPGTRSATSPGVEPSTWLHPDLAPPPRLMIYGTALQMLRALQSGWSRGSPGLGEHEQVAMDAGDQDRLTRGQGGYPRPRVYLHSEAGSSLGQELQIIERLATQDRT